MVPVANKPILWWQIEWLRRCGVHSFVLSVGHLAEQIRAHFGDGSQWGVEVDYVVEEEPLGTGGALRKALEQLCLQEPVYVANGDVLTTLDPREVEECRSEQKLIGGIGLVPLTSSYGIVEVDGGGPSAERSQRGLVRSFREKPVLPDYWINSGVYALAPEVFPYLPKKGSLEYDVFPALCLKGQLCACKYDTGFWRSIDNHKDIEEVSAQILRQGILDG